MSCPRRVAPLRGGSRWSYDGFCPDPDVFARLMGLDEPPKWKQRKFSKDDFEAQIGRIVGSARETGEFKMSGSYGVPKH